MRALNSWVVAATLLLAAAALRPVESRPDASVAVVFAPTGEKRVVHDVINGELRSARKSIDIAMFNFTSRRIAATLIELHKKGVKVRVLLDERSAKEISTSVHKELSEGGVDLRMVRLPGSGPRAAKFHHKFAVLDEAEVLTGSFNWTVTADEENYENLVVLRGKALASTFAKEFQRIWNDETITIK